MCVWGCKFESKNWNVTEHNYALKKKKRLPIYSMWATHTFVIYMHYLKHCKLQDYTHIGDTASSCLVGHILKWSAEWQNDDSTCSMTGQFIGDLTWFVLRIGRHSRPRLLCGGSKDLWGTYTCMIIVISREWSKLNQSIVYINSCMYSACRCQYMHAETKLNIKHIHLKQDRKLSMEWLARTYTPYLIELIWYSLDPWEQWLPCQHLHEYTANTPAHACEC